MGDGYGRRYLAPILVVSMAVESLEPTVAIVVAEEVTPRRRAASKGVISVLFGSYLSPPSVPHLQPLVDDEYPTGSCLDTPLEVDAHDRVRCVNRL